MCPHVKGWMDEVLVKNWLETVWKKVGGMRKRKSMLVWESYRGGHLSESVKRKMRELQTVPAIIPGGMTSMVQPLDVCVNKPFKDRVRKRWQEWMMDGEHTFTSGGRMRKVGLVEICEWIKKSWDDIPADLIRHSFKRCCITNAFDGIEDDMFWEDNPFEGLETTGDE